MQILRLFKLVFLLASFALPVVIIVFVDNSSHSHSVIERTLCFALYINLIFGYVIYLIYGIKDKPKQIRCRWLLRYNLIEVPLSLLVYFIYVMLITWMGIGVHGFPSDIH